MIAMAKNKKRGRPASGLNVPIQIRVSPEMAAALELLISRSRRTRNVELTIAIEEYLKACGVWPTKKDDNASD
jgi:hypothetical protein